MLNLTVIKAGNGDSLLLTWNYENKNYNLLIDGGVATSYKLRGRPGPLFNVLKEIKDKGERVNLLILTHVDNDHIGGILSGFSETGLLRELTDEVWFNSGTLIDKYFNKEVDLSHFLEMDLKESNEGGGRLTSINQGITFEKKLNELQIWDHELIIAGQTSKKFGAEFKILSPDLHNLEKLLIKWERENKKKQTSFTTDYHLTLDELICDDHFEGDKSIHNGSSIAFLFEFKSKKILFLADAFEEVLIDSIKKLKNEKGYIDEKNPLCIDIMKVSHHGSKSNTSLDLLKVIDTNKFIISTDGSCHGLPDKRALARIIKEKTNIEFFFNYSNLIDKIFSEDEKLKLLEAGIEFHNCDDVIEI